MSACASAGVTESGEVSEVACIGVGDSTVVDSGRTSAGEGGAAETDVAETSPVGICETGAGRVEDCAGAVKDCIGMLRKECTASEVAWPAAGSSGYVNVARTSGTVIGAGIATG